MEALSENDGEDDVTGAREDVCNGASGHVTNSCEVVEACVVVHNQLSIESGTASDLLSNSAILENHDLDPDLMKTRATSAPSDYDGQKRSQDHIHPRTTSDPRGMSAERLDGQAVTHFRDDDLCAHKTPVRSSIKALRAEQHSESSSGFTGDASSSATGSTSRQRRTEVAFAVSDVRETSCESYRTAPDRSRSDSVRTDTSGVSASERAIDVIAEEGGSDFLQLHPSSHLRRSLNLRRVPNYQRRFSNPVLTPILKTLQQDCDVVSEYTLSFTSSRDVHGYATLRDLKRNKRADSNSSDPEVPVMRPLSENFATSLKSNNLDLRLFTRLRLVLQTVPNFLCLLFQPTL